MLGRGFVSGEVRVRRKTTRMMIARMAWTGRMRRGVARAKKAARAGRNVIRGLDMAHDPIEKCLLGIINKKRRKK
jgi:hypothetical protein